MKIEFAPKEYWKQMSADEAILYCFSLTINGKIGWRLPTEQEWCRYPRKLRAAWDQADVTNPLLKNALFDCRPVRDLKDD